MAAPEDPRPALQEAIADLQARRAVLGDALVDAALGPLLERLAALTSQASPAEPGRKLRQVSVLFVDIVGSTQLIQHLDPEDVQSVVDGALAAFTTIIERHGGEVLRYAGDNAKAAFGASGTREDDAERAVRCGLELLQEAARRGESVRREHGRDGFNARVGIHTGAVVRGGGVELDNSMSGLAVNVAARMEQAAPTGGLRISQDTYARVRGVFDAEVQPAIEIKGLDRPLVTYLIHRAKPRAFRTGTRGVDGVQTRMVGRDAELGRLQAAFLHVCERREWLAVFAVGEAGLGKSRLLDEFAEWSETRPERFHLFRGRADPETQSRPYGLLRDVLAWRLQIADGDSMQAAKAKLEEGLVPLLRADSDEDTALSHAHLLGQLIGLDFADSRHVKAILNDGRQIRNRGFHAAALMFRQLVARDAMPAVLQLEDLHWADDGSLDFLSHLAETSRDVPLLVLCLTRPALYERRPDWNVAALAHSRVDIEPLGKGHSRDLANELLKKLPAIPAVLRELLIGGAEGNPFYMEELLKMLVDEGAILTGDPHWSVRPDKLLATRVPPTLVGVLQARLDTLQAEERLALQKASVIGPVFWDQALAAIDAASVRMLPPLVRRQLLVARDATSLEGTNEYAFGHHLLHQVTYDTVLKPTRRELHARMAAWLAGSAGSRAGDFLAVTARHFREAGDRPQAREFFARAAEDAAQRFAQQAALDAVASALELVDNAAGVDDPPLRWRLVEVHQRVMNWQGRRVEQRADVEALQEIADALDDDAKRVQVALIRADYGLRVADYPAMMSAARLAMTLADNRGDTAQSLRGRSLLAIATCQLGDAAAAKALTVEGLAAARQSGLDSVEAIFLNTLAYVSDVLDDRVAHLEAIQQDLQLRRKRGDRYGEAIALSNLGYGWLLMGDDAKALPHLQEGLLLHRAVGNRASQAHPLCMLSQLALRQHDAVLALAHARSALEVAAAVKAPERAAVALCCVGDAELALGRSGPAAEAFEQAEAQARDIGHPFQFDALAGRARVALMRGDDAAALLHANDLLAHANSGGNFEGAESRRLIKLTCYRVLARAGDSRAAPLLADAYAELQSRAKTLTDAALRRSFLDNVPEHREIVSAWESEQASASAGRDLASRS
jgi:class 3 adenylate cyclase